MSLTRPRSTTTARTASPSRSTTAPSTPRQRPSRSRSTAVNDAPSCSAVSLTTDEDTPGDANPSCTDIDSASLTYAIVGAASHGTASIVAGKLHYVPNANYNGSDSFTYKANDGALDSNTATVSVTVNAVNDAPSCSAVSLTTDEDTPGDANPSCADIDSASLTYAIVGAASHGTASIVAGKLHYVPNANYNGSDSFTYKANDGALDSNTATVSVTVNAGQRRARLHERKRDDGRGHAEGDHARLHRCRLGFADVLDRLGPLARQRHGRHGSQPHLLAGPELQRLGQLHLPGQRRRTGQQRRHLRPDDQCRR